MTVSKWQKLYSRLDINTRMGKPQPITAAQLDSFEQQLGNRLPRSYREYCEVFGPGEVAERFKIAVPGYQGPVRSPFSLEHLNKLAHDGLEYQVYSKDPAQHERGIFFSIDILRSYHFFDPQDITDLKNNEYAVYTLFKDFEAQRTANSFWDFVSDYCLGAKYDELYLDEPPQQLFMPG